MASEKPAKSHRGDPAIELLDSAFRDSALILDAYGRFAAAAIGTLLFPYAASLAPERTGHQSDTDETSRARHRGIVQVFVALLIGLVLGRRLVVRRGLRRR